MKAVLVINYASEEDIGKKTSIHLLNEENEWVEDVVIRPLPQEKHDGLVFKSDGTAFTKEMEIGWNTCLAEITGETE